MTEQGVTVSDRVWLMKQGLIPRDEDLISKVDAAYEAARFRQRQERLKVLQSMRESMPPDPIQQTRSK